MAGLGPITQKRTFGGLTFYQDGLIFGMVIDDALFLKADDQSKSKFEAEGLPQFTYAHKSGKSIGMSYWPAPER
jgi:DNA transformation protein and related proteins